MMNWYGIVHKHKAIWEPIKLIMLYKMIPIALRRMCEEGQLGLYYRNSDGL